MTRRVAAWRDPGLRARIVRRVPLRYAAGADAALDRPAHVRAASGLAWIGGRLAIIQDDANFIVVADPATGLCDAVTLPPGEAGLRQFDDLRGNKRYKLDLEACTVVREADGEVLVAFGSGSTRLRDRILLVRGLREHPAIELHDAPAFYAGLLDAAEFAGSELNVEGAAWRDGRIVLFNRGNGAPVGEREPVDATCEIVWAALRDHLADPGRHPPPAPERILQYELGEIGGLRLTFTDAALVGDALVFTATAEDSPDAVRDGPVAGSAIGIIGADGEARWAAVEDAEGRPLAEKVEGVAPGTRPGTALIVIDRDDPRAPSELCEVELSGDWPRR